MSIGTVTTMGAAVTGRQPITDRANNAVGYELSVAANVAIHTSSTAPAPRGVDSDGRVFLDSTSPASLFQRLTGGAWAFVHSDAGFLTRHASIEWPADLVYIHIAARDLGDREIQQGCATLREAGYRLAAANVEPHDDIPEICHAVDILSVNMHEWTAAALRQVAAQCHRSDTQLHVRGIDTAQDVEQAQLGRADLVQGLATGRSPATSSNALNPSQHNTLKLASTIMRAETDLDAVEDIVRADPALTYQLLQIASVGRLGEPRRNVRSIRDALVLMGMDRLRGWVPALMMRPAGRAIDSRLPTVLARARTVEILASQRHPQDAGGAFAAGMLSAFDLLLPIPSATIADALDLPPALRADAFGTDTPVAKLVGDVIDQERGRPAKVLSGAGTARMNDGAARGFGWAIATISAIDENVVI